MAWLVGAPPAWADDESEAKAACKQIAEGRDWDDSKAKVSKEGENRIVVTMTGERALAEGRHGPLLSSHFCTRHL